MLNKYVRLALALAICQGLLGCGSRVQEPTIQQETASGETQEETLIQQEELEMAVNFEDFFKGKELAKNFKGLQDNNPIMTQRFGADPYAMVYGDRVYFYMTQDTPSYEADGSLKENDYQNINTISVCYTEDMINFVDCGEIPVAGPNGAAKWAKNSWAPAAAWKMIDGKPKFFLYFADAGGGIGVLCADDPAGPFRDEVGKGLLRRDMKNCDNVLWLFDPAVLVDDDGTGYIYFGGGVPEGKVAEPGTGRVAKLGDDMMSIVGDPVALDVPYLFEDSGIHKYKDTYYYTYCSNWQVDDAGTEKYGIHIAEIVCLESKNPMGPFTFKEVILRNPGSVFGLYGNNHHCVFSFKDQWYMTYHTRLMEQKMGWEKGYRCTHIDPFTMGEDGTIGIIEQTTGIREQISNPSAKAENFMVNMSNCAGVTTEKIAGQLEMVACPEDGGFIKVSGVDFSSVSPKEIAVMAKGCGETSAIRITVDRLNSEAVAYIDVTAKAEEFTAYTGEVLKEVTGIHDVYFTFSGEGCQVNSWQAK